MTRQLLNNLKETRAYVLKTGLCPPRNYNKFLMDSVLTFVDTCMHITQTDSLTEMVDKFRIEKENCCESEEDFKKTFSHLLPYAIEIAAKTTERVPSANVLINIERPLFYHNVDRSLLQDTSYMNVIESYISMFKTEIQKQFPGTKGKIPGMSSRWATGARDLNWDFSFNLYCIPASLSVEIKLEDDLISETDGWANPRITTDIFFIGDGSHKSKRVEEISELLGAVVDRHYKTDGRCMINKEYVLTAKQIKIV